MFLKLLGIIIVVFVVLAATNGLKRHVKHPFVKAIAKQHRLFGALAAGFALIHMIVAVSSGETRIAGLLALVAVLVTAVLGGMVYKLKNKTVLMVHRISGPVAFLLIIIHIFTN
jgi:hypothetical protein